MKSRNLIPSIPAIMLALSALTGCVYGPATQPATSPTAKEVTKGEVPAPGQADSSRKADEIASADENATTKQSCPVTPANGSQPPGETVISPRHHGNGMLWTVLPEQGKLTIAPDKSGKLGWKFPWWRGVVGELTIEGRSLDGARGEVTSTIPEGYGDTGFQSTGIFFPGEGCWEITGRAGKGELTFVVEVRQGAV